MDPTAPSGSLCNPDELRRMDAYWRAANYLSVGQIYLYANPLLREPLTLAHVKPLVVGHLATTPGQNFIYVHLNQVIKKFDLDMFYVAGPGHSGPALVAQTFLEGSYSEIYPDISQGEAGLAGGVVITPSHNPPGDGGFKYNTPDGGPADLDVTGGIEQAANALLTAGLGGVKRIPLGRALKSAQVHRHDYIGPCVEDLAQVVDMDIIRSSGVRVGIDPRGGAAVGFWQPIIEPYGIAATVVSSAVDPTFRFMTADWDGRIRMDCSSPMP